MALIFKCDVCAKESEHEGSLFSYTDNGETKDEVELCLDCYVKITKFIYSFDSVAQ